MCKRAVASTVFLVFAQTSVAADVFSVTATVGSQTNSKGFNIAGKTFDSLRQEELNALLPTYTGTQVANVAIDFRGLPLLVSYPVTADPTLVLNIPGLGITKTFVGATREESRRQLRDYFKNGDALGRIMKELARVSPVDPIAGNPNSLQSRMIAGDFDRNFRAFATNIMAAPAAATSLWEWPVVLAANTDGSSTTDLPGTNAMRAPNTTLGVGASAYRAGGIRTVSASFPLVYSFPPDPARPLSAYGALFLSDTQGAKTYGLSAGGAYRFLMNDRWYLTPAANFGITGSSDLGSLGEVASGSLTSSYLIHTGKYFLSMGNTVSYSRTLRSSAGSYSSDPKIENTAFTNGLALSIPLSKMEGRMSVDYYVTDTRFVGTSLNNNYSDEIGVAIGTSKNAGGALSYLRGGVSYIRSPHSKGFSLNASYSF